MPRENPKCLRREHLRCRCSPWEVCTEVGRWHSKIMIQRDDLKVQCAAGMMRQAMGSLTILSLCESMDVTYSFTSRRLTATRTATNGEGSSILRMVTNLCF